MKISKDEFTTEELLEDCLSLGLIEEGEEQDYEHWQLAKMIEDYNEEAAAQDHSSSFYSW